MMIDAVEQKLILLDMLLFSFSSHFGCYQPISFNDHVLTRVQFLEPSEVHFSFQ